MKVNIIDELMFQVPCSLFTVFIIFVLKPDVRVCDKNSKCSDIIFAGKGKKTRK